MDHGGPLRSMFGVGRSERAPSWAPSKGTTAWKAGRTKAAGLRPFPRNRTTVRASRLPTTPPPPPQPPACVSNASVERGCGRRQCVVFLTTPPAICATTSSKTLSIPSSSGKCTLCDAPGTVCVPTHEYTCTDTPLLVHLRATTCQSLDDMSATIKPSPPPHSPRELTTEQAEVDQMRRDAEGGALGRRVGYRGRRTQST